MESVQSSDLLVSFSVVGRAGVLKAGASAVEGNIHDSSLAECVRANTLHYKCTECPN